MNKSSIEKEQTLRFEIKSAHLLLYHECQGITVANGYMFDDTRKAKLYIYVIYFSLLPMIDG